MTRPSFLGRAAMVQTTTLPILKTCWFWPKGRKPTTLLSERPRSTTYPLSSMLLISTGRRRPSCKSEELKSEFTLEGIRESSKRLRFFLLSSTPGRVAPSTAAIEPITKSPSLKNSESWGGEATSWSSAAVNWVKTSSRCLDTRLQLTKAVKWLGRETTSSNSLTFFTIPKVQFPSLMR